MRARLTPTTIGLVGFGRWGWHIVRDRRALGAAVHVVAPSAASRQAAATVGIAPAKPIPVAIRAALPLRAELAAFLFQLRGGPQPRSSAREGLPVVERIHELRRLAGLS